LAFLKWPSVKVIEFSLGTEDDMKDFIYLDHNATTPIDPGAAAVMKVIMEEEFGNPSSGYFLGTRAKQKVEQAREEIAGLLHADGEEIV